MSTKFATVTSPIIRAYENAFKTKQDRGWEKIYILVDLHGTVIHPNWSDTELPQEYYPNSLEVLRNLTDNPEVCLILWTSSWEHDYNIYRARLAAEGVHFNYVNSNPEVPTIPGSYGNFTLKPYFNVIFDDKAGFEPDEWDRLRTFLGA